MLEPTSNKSEDVLPPTSIVHVRALDLKSVSSGQRDAFANLLDADERERAGRFVRPENRDEYVCTRGLFKTSIGRTETVDPASVRVTYGPSGEPLIDEPPHLSAVQMSLSHTAGCVACAWSTLPVGVDVEAPREVDHMKLAERFFAREEADAIRKAPDNEQRERFLQIWTLKEAVLKVSGLGMAFGLDKFIVTVDGAPAPYVRFRSEEQPGHWALISRRLASGHFLGVCVARATDEPFAIEAVW